jgi:hypothetical protein
MLNRGSAYIISLFILLKLIISYLSLIGGCWSKMRLCVYIMIHLGRRGRKPGYIHEMGSHDLKSCEVKCQRNRGGAIKAI